MLTFVFTGCPEATAADPTLNGTWVGNNMEFKFDNGNFEVKDEMKGTYTTKGDNITITTTHRWESPIVGLEAKWYSKDDYKKIMELGGISSDEDIDDMFFSKTGTYSVSDSKLTLTLDGDASTYTKK
jgi:hypothetical protein